MSEQPVRAKGREKVKDIVARGDSEEIKRELAELLDRLGDGSGQITVWVATLYISTLQKLAIADVERAVDRITESSNRLEGLTKSVVSLTRWLVRLTIALGVLTLTDIVLKFAGK